MYSLIALIALSGSTELKSPLEFLPAVPSLGFIFVFARALSALRVLFAHTDALSLLVVH